MQNQKATAKQRNDVSIYICDVQSKKDYYNSTTQSLLYLQRSTAPRSLDRWMEDFENIIRIITAAAAAAAAETE